MSFLACKSAATAATVAALVTSVSTAALAQDSGRTLANNEAILIDGKALTITPGRSRDDIAAKIGNLSVRPLGPGAIVFRSGDRLYVVDGTPMGSAHAMYDPGSDRQRSYGGLNDDRQRSYGGLYDPYPAGDRNDRQQSYGGLYDPYPAGDRNDRQQSYGGLYDPYPSSDRNDRQRSYGGLNDRQQSYGGFYDPDYANYRMKKAFGEIWGAPAKN